LQPLCCSLSVAVSDDSKRRSVQKTGRVVGRWNVSGMQSWNHATCGAVCSVCCSMMSCIHTVCCCCRWGKYVRSAAMSHHDFIASLHCNTLQHPAAICNALQDTVAHCKTLQDTGNVSEIRRWNHDDDTARHCNTLQHTATHCNTLQHRWGERVQNAAMKLWTMPKTTPSISSPPNSHFRSKLLHHSSTTQFSRQWPFRNKGGEGSGIIL